MNERRSAFDGLTAGASDLASAHLKFDRPFCYNSAEVCAETGVKAALDRTVCIALVSRL